MPPLGLVQCRPAPRGSLVVASTHDSQAFHFFFGVVGALFVLFCWSGVVGAQISFFWMEWLGRFFLLLPLSWRVFLYPSFFLGVVGRGGGEMEFSAAERRR